MDEIFKYKSLVLYLALLSTATAGEVKLVWDPNPPQDLVQSYIVYEHIDKTFAPVAVVSTNAVTLTNVPRGEHCYVVTASNFWGESVFSNEACTRVVVDGVDDPDYEDLMPPLSFLYPLPAESGASFQVSWWGLDEQGGTGISYYDVFVSVDGGPFSIWIAGTGLQEAYYDGIPGHTYGFYVEAVDRAGNRSATPDGAEAWTRVTWQDEVAPIVWMFKLPPTNYPAFEVSWWGLDEGGGSGVSGYDIYVSDNGGAQQLWLKDTWVTSATYIGVLGHSYEFLVVASDRAGNTSARTSEAITETQVTRFNVAPKLEPLSLQTAEVGQILMVTNRATDADQPLQTLTYSLINSGVVGAVMDADRGILTWTPTASEAGEIISFDIMVTDDGYPSLSAVQRVLVQVGHTFQVTLDSKVVRPGELGTLPLTVTSSKPLEGMYLRLRIRPESVLKDLQWVDGPEGECSGLLWQEDATTYWLILQNCNPSLFPGQREIGHVEFRSTAAWQGLVQVEVDQVLGLENNLLGETDTEVAKGRLAIVDEAPLLELVREAEGGYSMVLYGKAGKRYHLEIRSSANALPGWVPVGEILLNQDVQTLGVISYMLEDAFFRLRVLEDE